MPDTTQLMFNLPEVVKALLKQEGITEGHWQLSVRFGLGAGNLASEFDETVAPRPTAFIPVVQVGIKRADRSDEFTVDASKLAPKKKAKKNAATRSKRKAANSRPSKKKTVSKAKPSAKK